MLGAPTDVSLWRREPYRLLFPLGALMAVAGALPWLLYALGFIAYPRVFHALVQVQAFIACFIGGFLFTFVPRRTGGPPPSRVELSLAVLCPVALAVLTGLGKISLAESAWFVWLLVIGRFVLARLSKAPMAPKPVPSMAWVPMSLGIGVFGTLVAGITAVQGKMVLHDIGQRLALQAMVAGLVMGIGGLLLPVLTRRSAAGAQRLPRWAHIVAALVFWASYPLEVASVPAAFAVRAAVAGLVLVWGAELWRLPEQRGLQVWLAWLGAWALPLGHALVAVLPQYRVAGLHLVFLGCFGALVFAIGAHVTYSHGNRSELLRQPWYRSRLTPAALALAVALVARLALDVSGTLYLVTMGIAAVAFCAAALGWLWAVLPVALRPPVVHELEAREGAGAPSVSIAERIASDVPTR